MFGKSKNKAINHPGLSDDADRGASSNFDIKPKKSRKKLIATLAVFIVVALVGSLYVYYNFDTITNKKTLNNNRLYREAVKSFENLPGVKNLSEEDRNSFKANIMPEYLAAYVAGFAPTVDDLGGDDGFLATTNDQFLIETSIKRALDENFERVKKDDFNEGYLFQFWYGTTIVNKLPNEEIKDWGNEEVLKADKEYALAKANEYRSQLIDKKITPEELTDKLRSDSRLTLYDEQNGSGKIYRGFGTSEVGLIDDGRQESFDKVISEQKEPIITEIYPIVADPGIPPSGEKREVGYFFVDLSKSINGQEAISFYNSQLEIAKKRLK